MNICGMEEFPLKNENKMRAMIILIKLRDVSPSRNFAILVNVMMKESRDTYTHTFQLYLMKKDT